MARVVDITDMLNFEEKPSIRIKGVDIELNDDAPSMLEVTTILQNSDDMSPADINRLTELLFEPEEYKKLIAMKLNMKNFAMAIIRAANIAIGTPDDDEGEAQTPAMT